MESTFKQYLLITRAYNARIKRFATSFYGYGCLLAASRVPDSAASAGARGEEKERVLVEKRAPPAAISERDPQRGRRTKKCFRRAGARSAGRGEKIFLPAGPVTGSCGCYRAPCRLAGVSR